MTKTLARLALAAAATAAVAIAAVPADAAVYCHDFKTFEVCTPV